MRNVFFVNSTLGLGGGVRVIFNWSNFLAENDHRVTLISNSREPILYELNKKVNVTYLDIEKNGKNFLLLSLYKFYRAFFKVKNSTLIFNKGQYILVIYILRKLRLISNTNKFVYYMHGGSGQLLTMYNNHRIYMINKTFDRVVVLYDDLKTTTPIIDPRFSRRLLNYPPKHWYKSCIKFLQIISKFIK